MFLSIQLFAVSNVLRKKLRVTITQQRYLHILLYLSTYTTTIHTLCIEHNIYVICIWNQDFNNKC
jgi:hypothetical protein